LLILFLLGRADAVDAHPSAHTDGLATDAASTNVDMNQPQGKQLGSVDSQRESRNQPAARAVRVLAPRRMRIELDCKLVLLVGEIYLSKGKTDQSSAVLAMSAAFGA
jgi:hypothetical protein